jgi:lysophospholipase L1-like esterase
MGFGPSQATGQASYLPGLPPTQLPGGAPDNWWQAGSLVQDDMTQVTSWADRIAGKTLATGQGTATYIAASRELGGRPAVQLVNASLVNADASFGSQAFTLALVVYPFARGYDQQAYVGTGAAAFFNFSTAGALQFADPANGQSAGMISGKLRGQEPLVIVFRGSAADFKGWVNGEEGSRGAAVTLKTYTGLKLGCDGQNLLLNKGFLVAEVALWGSRTISDTELALLAQYWRSFYASSRQHAIELALVAGMGDSLTEGIFLQNLADIWPQQLRSRLGFHCDVRNFGISGAQATNISSALSIFNPSVVPQRPANIAALMVGTNSQADASRYTNLTNLLTNMASGGWSRIVCTIPDCVTTYLSQANRDAYNASIRSHSLADPIAEGFADIAADYRIGRTGANADTAYFQSDGIHLKPAGQAIVAEHVAAAIRQYLGLWPNTFPWTSTDNTTNVAREIVLQNAQQYIVEVHATCRRMDSGTEYAYHARRYLAFVTGGAITLLAAETDVNTRSTLLTETIALTSTGLRLQITATGETGKTLQWAVRVNLVKTTL